MYYSSGVIVVVIIIIIIIIIVADSHSRLRLSDDVLRRRRRCRCELWPRPGLLDEVSEAQEERENFQRQLLGRRLVQLDAVSRWDHGVLVRRRQRRLPPGLHTHAPWTTKVSGERWVLNTRPSRPPGGICGESFYVDALRRWMMMIIIINVIIIIIIIINIFVSRSETLITFGKQKQVGKCINVRTKKTLEKRMHNKKKSLTERMIVS